MFNGTRTNKFDNEHEHAILDNGIVHPRTGLQAIGFLKDGSPIWPVVGGAIDVEPEDDGEPNDERSDGDGDDEWTPPTREEFEELLRSKRSANKEAMERRRYLEAHGIDWKTGERRERERDRDTDDDAKTSPAKTESARRSAERAAAKVEMRYKPAIARLAVKGALTDAGWTGKDTSMVMKLIDLDDIAVDDDGEVTGITDQIEAIRAEFPSWFRKTREPKAETGGSSELDGGRKTAPTGGSAKNSWADNVASRLMRGQ